MLDNLSHNFDREPACKEFTRSVNPPSQYMAIVQVPSKTRLGQNKFQISMD